MHRLRQPATKVAALLLIVTLGTVALGATTTMGAAAFTATAARPAATPSNGDDAAAAAKAKRAADEATFKQAVQIAKWKHAVQVSKYIAAVHHNNMVRLWVTLTNQRAWFAAVAQAQAAAQARPTYGGRCGGDLPPCCVMMRESGGSLTAKNPHSSASGKWQFVDGTWNNFGGYAHAWQAPESVQDAKARQIWAGGAGRSAWGGGC